MFRELGEGLGLTQRKGDGGLVPKCKLEAGKEK